MLVRIESTMKLSEELDKATESNNIIELTKIIHELNSNTFPDHKSLILKIRESLLELDPFEPETVVNYILNNIRPELRQLVDPVHMILTARTSKPKWFRCFQGTRT